MTDDSVQESNDSEPQVFVYAGTLTSFIYDVVWGGQHTDPQDFCDALTKACVWGTVVCRENGQKPWSDGVRSESASFSMPYDAYGALMIRVASAMNSEPSPKMYARGTDPFEHDVLVRAIERDVMPPFFICSAFIPMEEVKFFSHTNPIDGEGEVFLMSTGGLRKLLSLINMMFWKASPEEIESWAENVPETSDMMETDVLARYAFSQYSRALWWAEDHDLPLMTSCMIRDALTRAVPQCRSSPSPRARAGACRTRWRCRGPDRPCGRLFRHLS